MDRFPQKFRGENRRGENRRTDPSVTSFSPALRLAPASTRRMQWLDWLAKCLVNIDTAVMASVRIVGQSCLKGFASYGAAFHGHHPDLHTHWENSESPMTQEERDILSAMTMADYEEDYEDEVIRLALTSGEHFIPLHHIAQPRRRV
jgi:hypothetical protein